MGLCGLLCRRIDQETIPSFGQYLTHPVIDFLLIYSQNAPIYSYHVWEALSRKGTWCLNAKDGHQLYQEYSNHSDVVAALQDTSQKGHSNFLALLKRVAGDSG